MYRKACKSVGLPPSVVMSCRRVNKPLGVDLLLNETLHSKLCVEFLIRIGNARVEGMCCEKDKQNQVRSCWVRIPAKTIIAGF